MKTSSLSVFESFDYEKERGKADTCEICFKSFDLLTRQHICKRCFRSVCDLCANNKVMVFKDNFARQAHRMCRICKPQSDSIRHYIESNKLRFGGLSNIAIAWLKKIPKDGRRVLPQKRNSSISRFSTIDFTEDMLNELWNSLNYSLRQFVGLLMIDEPRKDILRTILNVLRQLGSIEQIRVQYASYIVLFLLCYCSQEVTVQIASQLLFQLKGSQRLGKDTVTRDLEYLEVNDVERRRLEDFVDSRYRRYLSLLSINAVPFHFSESVIQEALQKNSLGPIHDSFVSIVATTKEYVLENGKNRAKVDLYIVRCLFKTNLSDLLRCYIRLTGNPSRQPPEKLSDEKPGQIQFLRQKLEIASSAADKFQQRIKQLLSQLEKRKKESESEKLHSSRRQTELQERITQLEETLSRLERMPIGFDNKSQVGEKVQTSASRQLASDEGYESENEDEQRSQRMFKGRLSSGQRMSGRRAHLQQRQVQTDRPISNAFFKQIGTITDPAEEVHSQQEEKVSKIQGLLRQQIQKLRQENGSFQLKIRQLQRQLTLSQSDKMLNQGILKAQQQKLLSLQAQNSHLNKSIADKISSEDIKSASKFQEQLKQKITLIRGKQSQIQDLRGQLEAAQRQRQIISNKLTVQREQMQQFKELAQVKTLQIQNNSKLRIAEVENQLCKQRQQKNKQILQMRLAKNLKDEELKAVQTQLINLRKENQSLKSLQKIQSTTQNQKRANSASIQDSQDYEYLLKQNKSLQSTLQQKNSIISSLGLQNKKLQFELSKKSNSMEPQMDMLKKQNDQLKDQNVKLMLKMQQLTVALIKVQKQLIDQNRNEFEQSQV